MVNVFQKSYVFLWHSFPKKLKKMHCFSVHLCVRQMGGISGDIQSRANTETANPCGKGPVIPFPNKFHFRWSFLYAVNIFENDFYASVAKGG